MPISQKTALALYAEVLELATDVQKLAGLAENWSAKHGASATFALIRQHVLLCATRARAAQTEALNILLSDEDYSPGETIGGIETAPWVD